MSDLAKRTIKNSSYGLIEYIWPVLLAFFLTPFIISKLGTELFGIYVLSTVFIGFLAFLDLGMTTAALRDISLYYSKKEYRKINETIGAALAAYSIVGIFGALLAILVAGPIVNIMKISPQNIDIAKFAFYFIAILFPCNILIGAIGIIPKAIQRYDITTKVSLLIATLNTIGVVCILSFGLGGLKEILLLGLLLNLLAGLLYYYLSKKIVKSLELNLNFSLPLIKSMFSFGGYASITSLSGTILFQLDKLIVGAVLGINSVAYYSVPSNLAQKIHGGVTALTNVIFPLTSELQGNGKREQMISMYFKSSRLIIMLTTAGVVALSVFHREFIYYWLHQDFVDKSSFVFLILIVTYYFISYSAIPFYITIGVGKSKVTALVSSINAVINIALIFLLIYKFAIIGVALAYLLSVITVPIFIRYVEKYILKLKGFEVFVNNKDIYLVALIQGVISYYLLRQLANSLLDVVILLFGSFILFFIIMYVAKLYSNDDKKIFSLIFNKVSNRS